MIEPDNDPEDTPIYQEPQMPHPTCTYPYPSYMEVVPAAQNILAKLRGEEVELNCLIHCGYTVEGFAFSVAFPDNHEPHAMTAPSNAEFNAEASIEALATWDGKSMMALPWLQIALFVGELLIKWLKDRG